eukprot:IDg6282t1
MFICALYTTGLSHNANGNADLRKSYQTAPVFGDDEATRPGEQKFVRFLFRLFGVHKVQQPKDKLQFIAPELVLMKFHQLLEPESKRSYLHAEVTSSLV